ncbi:FAD-dependent oxidoreductase [Glaciimonas sp. CA11.2]|uniref:NAD(P)/FAD-dependent oxidoreductase n=1 Tax=unclassified Glaciimonas TaxID=2644401 RepID=UPI002AB50C84|nr:MULTISPECIES: FAD-dependent oxidoreductase [unclassified Glaciimonas]MDY7547309.1 FAD-dependent oxidoreductase [Glaciimonas sp. CA11.2]MEB0012659.1 FAD-dependent oxidoreductase [Glaciimonas sp. Cout2]MEB0083000.1 FAD-dependent oxidoreductase [Glaciimonas sp. Gout2]MEB0164308.1 FAD-dependent oxidoreductase [Glaciimonas sp. CA11.2]
MSNENENLVLAQVANQTTAASNEVVIVGGGAGGLELACKLGRKLGHGHVTLVDRTLYHIWKPSLHEVAAGTRDIHQEGLSYQMLAHDNKFRFVYGALTALDAINNTITVDAINDEAGVEVVPPRQIAFGRLVIAVGSVSNYFGLNGAEKNTISLNSTEDAEYFRRRLLKLLTLADLKKEFSPDAGIDIVIVGGGATGVELAAELREASGVYTDYDFPRLHPDKDVRITILEGAPRLLAPLPERVANAATKLLRERDVRVVTGCRVASIAEQFVTDANGNDYAFDLCVWSAGIKAPDLLKTLGLPVTGLGQLQVDGGLKVKDSKNIYALGDCAACVSADGRLVPPRAQAAHQQADYLLAIFVREHKGQPVNTAAYVYTDHGSLVSFGRSTSVGTLMGSLSKLGWFVDGFFARMMYTSLHLLHLNALLGPIRTGVTATASSLMKHAKPSVKLH